MRAKWQMLASAVGILLLAIPLAAANSSAQKNAKNTKTVEAVRSVWPPETLSGKITMVEPNQKLLVVQSQDGVPFDMVVSPGTRIKNGNRTLSLNDLSQDVNQNVSIRFVPERRGDVARTIQIGG